MKLTYVKAFVAVTVALGVLLPSTISHAKSFSGRSSSSYSSRSSSSSYSGSYKSSPKSSYSSGSSSSSKKSKTSDDSSSSISLKKKSSEKSSSSSAKKSSGTFSGATSKVSGKTYSEENRLKLMLADVMFRSIITTMQDSHRRDGLDIIADLQRACS